MKLFSLNARKTTLAVSFALAAAGTAGMVHGNDKAETSLRTEYGLAAQCTQNQALKQPCTAKELETQAVVHANVGNQVISMIGAGIGVVMTIAGATL